MPGRPQPIIIPGPSGMGGKSNHWTAQVDLGPLLNFIAGRKKKQREEENIRALTDALAPIPAPTEEAPATSEGLAASHAAQAEQLQPLHQQRGLIQTLARMAPKESAAQMLKQMFAEPKEPETQKDAQGFLRYTTGPQKGQRVFPDVEKPAFPEDISDTQLYSIFANSKDPAEKARAEEMLKFRRAQPEETRGVTLAKREAEAETAQKIKFNEEIGKLMADLQLAGGVEAAKVTGRGEVTAVQKKANAKGRVSNDLKTLAGHYLDLDSLGAMVNVENGTLENIWASTRASGVGQFVGKRIGTDEQSMRESINKLRPLLLQEIRQSTDMSARGLDSEKELEFYLQAATDPKQDIQSNIAAIVVLDEAYGTGEIANILREKAPESLVRRISNKGLKILNGGGEKKPEATGVPEGATLVPDRKTKSGAPVYRLPDGRLWTP